jgi:hypothetical protein
MTRRKSLLTRNRDIQIDQAVLDLRSGKYKSARQAEIALQLPKSSVTRRANGGLSRSQARQQQQKLSYAEEKVLLKWIKELTVSGYSPRHQLLKEMAEEIRTKRVSNLDDTTFSPIEPLPRFCLGQDWVPRFVQRHVHLKVRALLFGLELLLARLGFPT